MDEEEERARSEAKRATDQLPGQDLHVSGKRFDCSEKLPDLCYLTCAPSF